jgi:hypothetical protein
LDAGRGWKNIRLELGCSKAQSNPSASPNRASNTDRLTMTFASQTYRYEVSPRGQYGLRPDVLRLIMTHELQTVAKCNTPRPRI